MMCPSGQMSEWRHVQRSARIVPYGMVPNAPVTSPFPPGFDARPAPYGVSFAGRACSEARLVELAYAFERATKRRVPPPDIH